MPQQLSPSEEFLGGLASGERGREGVGAEALVLPVDHNTITCR